MLGGYSSPGNNILHEAIPQVGVGICQPAEFVNSTLEASDQFVNVQRQATFVAKPVSLATGIAPPCNIRSRITMNEAATKDLVEPLLTASFASRR
jgi:hypothetical protein